MTLPLFFLFGVLAAVPTAAMFLGVVRLLEDGPVSPSDGRQAAAAGVFSSLITGGLVLPLVAVAIGTVVAVALFLKLLSEALRRLPDEWFSSGGLPPDARRTGVAAKGRCTGGIVPPLVPDPADEYHI